MRILNSASLPILGLDPLRLFSDLVMSLFFWIRKMNHEELKYVMKAIEHCSNVRHVIPENEEVHMNEIRMCNSLHLAAYLQKRLEKRECQIPSREMMKKVIPPPLEKGGTPFTH